MKFKPLFILFLFQFGAFVYAQNAEKTYNLNKDGVAIEGYDLVSYFKPKIPLKGKQRMPYFMKGLPIGLLPWPIKKSLKVLQKIIYPNTGAGVPMPWPRAIR